MNKGDKNSKFFHQRASGRHRKNNIRTLKDESGEVHVGNEVVGHLAVAYFQNLFGSSNPPLITQALQDLQARVDDDMNVEDILALYSSFNDCVWSFVKRSSNRVAHALAHFQPVEVGKRLWVDDVPELINSPASADLI